MTHDASNVVATDDGYSPLWTHSVGDATNVDAVIEFSTALANVLAVDVGVDVNCPEVR